MFVEEIQIDWRVSSHITIVSVPYTFIRSTNNSSSTVMCESYLHCLVVRSITEPAQTIHFRQRRDFLSLNVCKVHRQVCKTMTYRFGKQLVLRKNYMWKITHGIWWTYAMEFLCWWIRYMTTYLITFNNWTILHQDEITNKTRLHTRQDEITNKTRRDYTQDEITNKTRRDYK